MQDAAEFNGVNEGLVHTTKRGEPCAECCLSRSGFVAVKVVSTAEWPRVRRRSNRGIRRRRGRDRGPARARARELDNRARSPQSQCRSSKAGEARASRSKRTDAADPAACEVHVK